MAWQYREEKLKINNGENNVERRSGVSVKWRRKAIEKQRNGESENSIWLAA